MCVHSLWTCWILVKARNWQPGGCSQKGWQGRIRCTTVGLLLRSQLGEFTCQQLFFCCELAVAGCIWLCLAPCLPQAGLITYTCAQLFRCD